MITYIVLFSVSFVISAAILFGSLWLARRLDDAMGDEQ